MWLKHPPRFDPTPWEQSTRTRLGVAGVTMLNAMLVLDPSTRVTAQSLSDADYLHPLRLRPVSDASGLTLFPGGRATLAFVAGHMDPRLLNWLREDPLFASPQALAELELSFSKSAKMQPYNAKRIRIDEGEKCQVAGLVDPSGRAQSVNGLQCARPLPCLWLGHFMMASKERNSSELHKLGALIRAALEALPSNSLGRNGQELRDSSPCDWMGSIATLQFHRKGTYDEPWHNDGGASRDTRSRPQNHKHCAGQLLRVGLDWLQTPGSACRFWCRRR